jgi:hypothetical protein
MAPAGAAVGAAYGSDGGTTSSPDHAVGQSAVHRLQGAASVWTHCYAQGLGSACRRL